MAERSGQTRLDPEKLNYLRHLRGWSVDDIERAADKRKDGLAKNTILKALRGEPIFINSAWILAQLFEVELPKIVATGELAPIGPPETWGVSPGHLPSLPDWERDTMLAGFDATTHPVPFVVWKLRHRFVPGKFGRGKVYDTSGLSTVERSRLHEYLLRHADVCNRLSGLPWFPRNLTTLPGVDTSQWWVVDEWREGMTLEERLRLDPPTDADAANLLREIAKALKALHDHGVVLRELTTASV